jgi:hypothetical protein
MPANPILVHPAGGVLNAQLTRLQLMQVEEDVQAAVDDGDCCEPFNAPLVNQSGAKTVLLLFAVPLLS